MKKISTLLITLICALCLVFSVVFTACGNNNGNGSGTGNGGTQGGEGDEGGEGGEGDETQYGSEDNPYSLEAGTINLDIPADGKVYYSAYSFGRAVTYTFISDSTNVFFTSYESNNIDGAVDHTSDTDGFYCEVKSEPMHYYLFVFSTKNFAADTYSVSVTISSGEDDGAGSENDPIIITDLKTYEKESVETVYYQYQTTAATTLYFSFSYYTEINASYPKDVEIDGETITVPVYSDVDELTNGWEVPANTTVSLIVSFIDPDDVTATTGDISFTISDERVVGTEDNPYTLNQKFEKNPFNGQESRTITIIAKEGESIYYSDSTWGSFNGKKYSVVSYDSNVKIEVYSAYDVNKESPVCSLESIGEDGIDGAAVELEGNGAFIFVFSTLDGAAGTYYVTFIVDAGEPGNSEDNPIIIENLDQGTYELEDISESVYYQYTTTSADAKLYFTIGDKTSLHIWSLDRSIELWSTEDTDLAKLIAGVSIPEGTVLIFEVGYSDLSGETWSGDVSFTVSNSPKA